MFQESQIENDNLFLSWLFHLALKINYDRINTSILVICHESTTLSYKPDTSLLNFSQSLSDMGNCIIIPENV